MMVIEMRAVSALKPYAKNAKKHPQTQIEHVANSIREFGWQQPLVISRDNTIVIGHCRLLAAKQLGHTEVPCVIADTLSDVQLKALRLADNKTNESEWDFGLLDAELDTIFDIDMGEFGFNESSIEFEAFDGDGDGGGSRMANGSNVRVVIGALIFDIADETHDLYNASRSLGEDTAKRHVVELLRGAG